MSTSWSSDEVRILRAHYDEEHDHKWVGWESLLPGRTPKAIYNKVLSLRLFKKSDERRYVMDETELEYVDRVVLACFRAGLTPSQIDEKMHWRPGKTKRILTEIWKKAPEPSSE